MLGTERLRVIKAIEEKKKKSHTILCLNSPEESFVSRECKFCTSFKGTMLKAVYTLFAWRCHGWCVPHTALEPAPVSELPAWILKRGRRKEIFQPFCKAPTHPSVEWWGEVFSSPIPQWLFMPPSYCALCTYSQVAQWPGDLCRALTSLTDGQQETGERKLVLSADEQETFIPTAAKPVLFIRNQSVLEMPKKKEALWIRVLCVSP